MAENATVRKENTFVFSATTDKNANATCALQNLRKFHEEFKNVCKNIGYFAHRTLNFYYF